MTHNVLIIGTGISGLSPALTLLQRGFAVTLLDRGEVGGESSWAGGGILSPLLPWEYSDPVIKLASHSMAIYPGWVATLEHESALSAEYWACGMRVLAPDIQNETLDWCRNHALPATRTADGLWLPTIAQVRNPRLIEVLRNAVLQLGGIIHTSRDVTAVTTSGSCLSAVDTRGGRFTADRYVFATGAWSGVFLPESDPIGTHSGLMIAPRIRPIRGQMLLFKLEPDALNTIIYRNGLYLIPRRDGHVLVGSTLEDVGFDKSTDISTRQRLHAQAAELLPILDTVQPIRHWSGLRPGSPDNIPIIDRHPDFDNVFVNTGHYRYGVTMAPASAELLADLIEGKTPALDPEPYGWQAALSRNWGGTL